MRLITLKTEQEINALVAQLVEQLICNQWTAKYSKHKCYSASKYKHHLSKKNLINCNIAQTDHRPTDF